MRLLRPALLTLTLTLRLNLLVVLQMRLLRPALLTQTLTLRPNLQLLLQMRLLQLLMVRTALIVGMTMMMASDWTRLLSSTQPCFNSKEIFPINKWRNCRFGTAAKRASPKNSKICARQCGRLHRPPAQRMRTLYRLSRRRPTSQILCR